VGGGGRGKSSLRCVRCLYHQTKKPVLGGEGEKKKKSLKQNPFACGKTGGPGLQGRRELWRFFFHKRWTGDKGEGEESFKRKGKKGAGLLVKTCLGVRKRKVASSKLGAQKRPGGRERGKCC